MKQVQCRLKLLKNKRNIMVKQLRDDVAELVKLGYEENAFNRAEQIFKDENTMAVYEILENYCEFLIINLSYIRRHKDCPNDINEAVSTLIFSSARCGELPELPAIRKLFGERYGQRFADGAVESYPGNLVNHEVKDKLSIKSVSEDVKLKLVEDIISSYCPQILAIEYPLELQQQYEENIPTCDEKLEDSPVQNSNIKEIDENSMVVEPDSIRKGSLTGALISDSVNSSMVQLSSPDVMESLVYNKEEKRDPLAEGSAFESEVGSAVETESQPGDATGTKNLKQKDKRLLSVSSTESLTQFFGENVVYLDDVEEIRSSVTKEENCQDQRLFKFKSLVSDYSDEFLKDQDNHDKGVSREKSGAKESRRNDNNKKYIKRSRRRSISQERSIMQDTDHDIYYEKVPSNKDKSHHRKKLQRNATEEEIEDEDRASPWKQKRGKMKMRHIPLRDVEEEFSGEIARTQVVQTAFPRSVRRRSYDNNGDSVCVVFTWPDEKREKEGKEALPFYLRAMTMPQERPKNIVRWNSCNLENPNHVHPKLPDCDEITAKFMALKKEYTQNKQ